VSQDITALMIVLKIHVRKDIIAHQIQRLQQVVLLVFTPQICIKHLVLNAPLVITAEMTSLMISLAQAHKF